MINKTFAFFIMEEIQKKIIIRDLSLTIRQMRKEKRMTQEDFLFDIGINMGRIEMGKRDIQCTTLLAICEKLCISPVDFFKEFERIKIEGPANNVVTEKTF